MIYLENPWSCCHAGMHSPPLPPPFLVLQARRYALLYAFLSSTVMLVLQVRLLPGSTRRYLRSLAMAVWYNARGRFTSLLSWYSPRSLRMARGMRDVGSGFRLAGSVRVSCTLPLESRRIPLSLGWSRKCCSAAGVSSTSEASSTREWHIVGGGLCDLYNKIIYSLVVCGTHTPYMYPLRGAGGERVYQIKVSCSKWHSRQRSAPSCSVPMCPTRSLHL
jgi:hypothetical protein